MLAAVTANVSGRLKSAVSEDVFMPDYLNLRSAKPEGKSLERQFDEWTVFEARYKAAQKAKR